jgi:hypothetical protein
MESRQLGKNTVAYGLAVAVASLFSAGLVVVKETSETVVLPWMAALTGHHWISHGLFNLIVFLAVGLVLGKAGGGQGLDMRPAKLVCVLVAAVVIGSLIISGFYLAD